MPYQPHQLRVIEEKQELDTKLQALRAFLDSTVFQGLPEAERYRLRRQAEVMADYSRILAERIFAFPVEPSQPSHVTPIKARTEPVLSRAALTIIDAVTRDYIARAEHIQLPAGESPVDAITERSRVEMANQNVTVPDGLRLICADVLAARLRKEVR